VIWEIILRNSLGDILRTPLTPFCRSQRELIPCGACRPGRGFLLRLFNVSFSKRFVWGSRRPADYDQKDIEDEGIRLTNRTYHFAAEFAEVGG